MGTKERRERERQETRARILDAARELFARDGFESVTMRAIADQIEYTPTAIYHHYRNKQELITELCQTDFQSLASHFVGAVTLEDPVDRIWAIGEAYLEFAESFPQHYRFLFMTVHPHMEHSPEYWAETHHDPERNAYVFLTQSCKAAIASGAFQPEYNDADQVAQILWAALHGLISLRITKAYTDWIEFKDLRQSARAALGALMRGMMVRVPAAGALP